MTAVVDGSVLYALVDAAEAHHSSCVDALASEPDAIVVPTAILPGVCTLIASQLGAASEIAFVRHLLDSDWRLESLANGDLARVLGLMTGHGIGYVDAVVAATAERMNARRVYTLDREHFERIRPEHVDRFELLPAG